MNERSDENEDVSEYSGVERGDAGGGVPAWVAATIDVHDGAWRRTSGAAPRVRRDTIVIGASAGGVAALRRLLGSLPAELPAALFVVLHQTADESELVDVLDAACALTVERVDTPRPIRPGRVYVAPCDRHMVVAGEEVRATRGPHERRTRPAINPLFRTAAVTRGARVVAVQLTGMLDDGVAGLDAVSRCGGRVLVQDPREAAYPEMPRSALEAVRADHVGPLAELAGLLPALVHERAPPVEIPADLALEARLALNDPNVAGDTDLGHSLMVAIQALGERADTLKRLAEGAARLKPGAATAYRVRAIESEEHADRLRRFLVAVSEEITPWRHDAAAAEVGSVTIERRGGASRTTSTERPVGTAAIGSPGVPSS